MIMRKKAHNTRQHYKRLFESLSWEKKVSQKSISALPYGIPSNPLSMSEHACYSCEINPNSQPKHLRSRHTWIVAKPARPQGAQRARATLTWIIFPWSTNLSLVYMSVRLSQQDPRGDLASLRRLMSKKKPRRLKQWINTMSNPSYGRRADNSKDA